MRVAMQVCGLTPAGAGGMRGTHTHTHTHTHTCECTFSSRSLNTLQNFDSPSSLHLPPSTSTSAIGLSGRHTNVHLTLTHTLTPLHHMSDHTRLSHTHTHISYIL
ncbi:uncharacterized protein V6R79_014197 [Siganus canaliculatus]